MKRKSKVFKVNIILAAMVLLSIGLVQVFAASPEETKISTVNWNMMSTDGNKGRSNTNLYWFKFAFLDRSMASGTIQEICSNEFETLKNDMKMQGYFYKYYWHGACPKGEYYGMGIIFRGKKIGATRRPFTAQPNKSFKYGAQARGMICVKHLYLDKRITSCVSHIWFDKDQRYHIKNNFEGGKQLREYEAAAKDYAYWTGGYNWAGSNVIFLNGDFNQLPDAVKRNAPEWQDLVKRNTHDARKTPTIQLDYIMVPWWILGRQEGHTSCNVGSDHCLTIGSVWV
jgi:hypothetical protein